MRNIILLPLLTLAVTLALPVHAQVAGEGDKTPERIEVPPLGVMPELERGLFVTLDAGIFFTLNSGAPEGVRKVSNAQPLLGVGLGYDITENIVAGASFTLGNSAGTCYSVDPATLACSGAESFSVVHVNAYGGYLHGLTHQWYLGGKLFGGLALLTPEPSVPAGDSGEGLAMGFNAGVLLSTEFHTHLHHFVVGLDIGGEFVSGAGVGFPGVLIYPRLKYVF
ncbi:MAG: hypothetical protein D6729_03150 [Deltaproteobacteria bacterium]|nr:MAG: hypothetical protein D6729_03150 [Deltaproteobacteria bacterium]